jgi:hypothetical protein
VGCGRSRDIPSISGDSIRVHDLTDASLLVATWARWESGPVFGRWHPAVSRSGPSRLPFPARCSPGSWFTRCVLVPGASALDVSPTEHPGIGRPAAREGRGQEVWWRSKMGGVQKVGLFVGQDCFLIIMVRNVPVFWPWGSTN